MIPPAELKALEEAVAALEMQDERQSIVRGGDELPGSDKPGNLSRPDFCQPSCQPNGEPTPVSHFSEDFLRPHPVDAFASRLNHL